MRRCTSSFSLRLLAFCCSARLGTSERRQMRGASPQVENQSSTPARFVGARLAKQLLNVGQYEAKSNISIQFLAPFIEHKTWAAFDSQFVCMLVICHQACVCDTVVDESFNGPRYLLRAVGQHRFVSSDHKRPYNQGKTRTETPRQPFGKRPYFFTQSVAGPPS